VGSWAHIQCLRTRPDFPALPPRRKKTGVISPHRRNDATPLRTEDRVRECDVPCHNKYRRKEKKRKEKKCTCCVAATNVDYSSKGLRRPYFSWHVMFYNYSSHSTLHSTLRPRPTPPPFLQGSIVRSSRRSCSLLDSSLPRKRRENLASPNYGRVLLGSLLRTLEGTWVWIMDLMLSWVIQSPAF